MQLLVLSLCKLVKTLRVSFIMTFNMRTQEDGVQNKTTITIYSEAFTQQ